jgi:hypothetical protein
MEENKLNDFNKELKELLAKYNCGLSIEQKIVVTPQPLPTTEVTGTEEIKTNEPTSTN